MNLKRIKVKLYPTVNQKLVLDNHFNAYRFLYNLCLEYKSIIWNDYKLNISGYDMQKEVFEIRKENDWLLKCKAECLRDAALQVDKSYKNFFKGKGFPKFKSKKNIQSFSAYQSIICKDNFLSFYKLKIKFKTSEYYVGLLNTYKIKQVTFKKDLCGDYFASFLLELPNNRVIKETEKVIGIDLGIKDLLITSDGDKFENKKYFVNSHYKLRRLQRRFSKTKKGGKNREKLRIKISKLHRKISRQKEWYYHQITNKLISDNQTIVMESLMIKNMFKNRKLSKSVSDASWGLLTSMLEYKSDWYNRKLIKISTWYPSSKTCSVCGNIKDKLLLSERIYNCECCGISIDRDINAAINIRDLGIKIPFKPMENTDTGQVYEVGSKNLK